ncbi:MAG: alpha/beta hydrolase [Candidatus Marinimicrobia bacterium]|nr:alpha/beta hydrolase [Candidatus Neomarinimicrobiota bacterium]
MKRIFFASIIVMLGINIGCGPKPVPKPIEKTAAYFDKTLYPGKTVDVNGIDIYYEKKGSGPNLILIEGLGVETWLYEENIPVLSEYFTTLVYDNRGVGHSSVPEGPYTIDMMMDDLVGLMKSLSIEKASFLGASMGGFMAMEMAIRHPEKVDKLVLLSTTAGGKEHVSMSMKTLMKLLKAPEGAPREVIRDRLTLAYTDNFMNDKKRVEHLIDLRLQNPQPKAGYDAQAAIGPKFDASDRIHTITTPTFIGHGRDDILVPVENAENMHKKIPNSTLKIYEGLEHQFFVEDYDTFNKDIIEFLKQ